MAARTKQQRAPGGGRKPKGEFAKLGSPSSIRLPPEMRDQLEAAAQRSGRSLSQEMLARLDSSLNRDRNKAVDPAMRALCFLFSQLAYSIHWNMPNWRSDRFLFKAIKIGITKLLDALEPSGQIKLPDFWKVHAAWVTDESAFEGNESLMKALAAMRESVIPAIQSPESMADYAVREILKDYHSPQPQKKWEDIRDTWSAMGGLAAELGPENHGRVLKQREDLYYGMNNARKDLRIKGEK
jgi:hypothetical protein